jgi:hypothetical protein
MVDFIHSHPYVCVSIIAGTGIGIGLWLGYSIAVASVVVTEQVVQICAHCAENDEVLGVCQTTIAQILDYNRDVLVDVSLELILNDHLEQVMAVVTHVD